MASYFDQFTVVSIIPGFTNSSLMLLLAIFFIVLFFKVNKLIPGRWQLVIELLYDHWITLIKDSLGEKGSKYFPFVVSLFMLIAWLNVLGLFPYIFTVGTHIIITFGLSFSILLVVTILGIKNFKLNFFSMLMPQGAPMGLAPLLVLIETASYLSRAISLGVRLAANLSAGHLLFAILASFGYQMIVGDLLFLSLFPLAIMVFITVLEIAVALIQAYVFCLLTTIYLEDTLKSH
ncbi:ATP synthase F0 subunit 6 (mitochondrion) [Rhopilema esculentum]|uniref:ATP synthase subunit a n=1 Tax=Rhopilema esculentum TaxID=499914 RepID=A0A222YTQ8_9CNID|nr:ATP synthase F0 subunit 6 [Rhopilema esculentum]ASR75169.1 ATP synthase F0 subunit 6 [Rhopilema esculentum]